ncbi:DTX23 [Symbiodinium natans]|uniref:DTX23 protein n=2 Tax=Symbiodinium TaxID=2949 RepID=A0A812MM77_9DINO|nr:DTX23 [Symbiodinium natans]
MGLTSALDTFVSQANGAGQYSLCTQYLQRSRVISTVQLLWMIPLLWFTDSILVAIG